MRVDIFFDGACSNLADTPSMGIGVALWVNKVRQPRYDISEGLEEGTSNIAEYRALIAALELAKKLHDEDERCRIYVFGDSQLIIKQANREWVCNAAHLRPYLDKVRVLLERRFIHYLGWVPREENKEADILSKIGLVKAYSRLAKQEK